MVSLVQNNDQNVPAETCARGNQRTNEQMTCHTGFLKDNTI